MTNHLCRSNTYIKSYGTSKFIDLTSRKGNPNGPQQGNGRNRRVTGREPSFTTRSLDQNGAKQHEEQLSSNGPSVILSSSPATGTHAGTPPLPAKKSGTGVLHPCATFWADESLVLVFHHVMLSKRMGHESSSFWTLFHVVDVFPSFIVFLLPLRATLRGVTFGNQSFFAYLRVEMGTRAVRVRDAFGF